MIATSYTWSILISAGLVAAWMDFHSWRIPNWLTLPLWVLGIAQAIYISGLQGLSVALASSLILSLPYIVLFLMAGGGAGDAKMMGAIGAWLTLQESWTVLICVATIGGLISLGKMILMRNGIERIRNMLIECYVLMTGLRVNPKLCMSEELTKEPTTTTRSPSHAIPYGIAIFLGVTLAAIITKWGPVQ